MENLCDVAYQGNCENRRFKRRFFTLSDPALLKRTFDNTRYRQMTDI